MYALLIILMLLAPIPIYIAFRSLFEDKRNRKGLQAVKNAYKRVVTRHSLSISEVSRFGNRLIAFDLRLRKLVLIIYKNGITWEKCINLEDIMFCQMVKTTNRVSGSIEKVELIFHNNNGIINFSFFDKEIDDVRDLAYRVKKTQYWKRKIQYQLSSLQTSNDNQAIPGNI